MWGAGRVSKPKQEQNTPCPDEGQPEDKGVCACVAQHLRCGSSSAPFLKVNHSCVLAHKLACSRRTMEMGQVTAAPATVAGSNSGRQQQPHWQQRTVGRRHGGKSGVRKPTTSFTVQSSVACTAHLDGILILLWYLILVLHQRLFGVVDGRVSFILSLNFCLAVRICNCILFCLLDHALDVRI